MLQKILTRLTSSNSSMVMVGLVLGIAVGLFFGEMVSWLKIVGDIFIRLLQITVIPFISVSLITGIGKLNFDQIKSLALKGGGILLLVWGLVVTVLFFLPLAFPDWPSSSFFSDSLVAEPTAPDFLRLFIPANPFYSFANAIVPAVVVFSIFIGLGLMALPDKNIVLEPLGVLREVLVMIAGKVTRLAPYGVFALMAATMGTIDFEDLVRLQVYLVIFSLSALFLGLWLLPALVTALTPLSHGQILRALRTPLVTGFATGSTLVILPLLIEQCRSLLAVEEKSKTDIERNERYGTSVKILVPVFYPFPQGGALLILMFPLFAAWYIGMGVDLSQYPQLILAGLPTLFGGSYLTISFLLDLLQLPSDLFQLFVSMDVVNARFGTLVGVMHYSTVALIGAVAITGTLQIRWKILVRVFSVSVALLVAGIFSVKFFYTEFFVAPYTKAENLLRLDLLGDRQPSVNLEPGEVPASSQGRPLGMHEIEETGSIRVCYQPNEFPSSFYNSAEPRRLVGFDIEMTHRLAKRVNLPIEFAPARNETTARDMLNAGICDLYMRSLPISGGRTLEFALTNQIYQSTIGLIVRDHLRQNFRHWHQAVELGASLKLGVDSSPESIAMMENILPEVVLLPIKDMEEQNQILDAGLKGLDAIADMAEEGAAWTLLYPEFSLVVPRPTKSIPVAYAVAHGNLELLNAVNAWLLSEKALGNIDELYEYWMLGGASLQDKPPRWSVIRDVLGWVK
jgi:Na+/H+-dicarboxylate symporter/ABC-type amino acid transport substrate-binding protein